MKWRFLPLLLLVLVPVQAGTDDVQFVGFDEFHTPTAPDFTTTVGCGGGAWVTEGDALRFTEGDTLGGTVAGGPYRETACGTASIELDVPAGADHIHVRFTSARIVDRLSEEVPVNIIEEVRVSTADGRLLNVIPMRAPDRLSTDPQFFDLDAILVPFGVERVRFTWYFEDRGPVVLDDITPAAGGVAYEATLDGVNIEFSDIPAVAELSSSDERFGTRLEEQIRIKVDVQPAEDALPALRIRGEAGLRFVAVVLPDGTLFEGSATVAGAHLTGFDLDKVQVEYHDSFTQITVPARLIEMSGPGNYELILTSVEVVEVVPALYPVLVMLFLAPLPLAVMAFLHARRFEKSAFGAYRRSARNLRWAVLAISVYYLAVVVGSLVSQRIDLLVRWPMPAEAWMVYIQVILAGVAFLVLASVARAMASITRS
ncbi:MAG: hypothetical protein ACPHID_08215 [Thermoplasmatota archaeon]